MIDRWFKEDLQDILGKHSVAVFIDETGDAEFLLKTVKAAYTVYRADSEIEELHVKYLIEKVQPSAEKFLIYTRTRKDDLRFIREYCEIYGCLEIRYLQNYIKDKVHQVLNLNINLPKEELVAAAKVSIGKDRTYWMDLSHKGATEIFDLKKELLPFVHDPEAYATEKYDAQLRETFYRKVNDTLGQEYLAKPATTLANEVVKSMLDCMVENSCHEVLDAVYKAWLDSVTYRDSFDGYLTNYSLPSSFNPWSVSPHHPFPQVDEQWLSEIGKKHAEKEVLANLVAKVRQRHQSPQAKALGVTFWADILTLLEFDSKDISYLSSFDECVDFYKKHFWKLDTAIRNLYAEFLNRRHLLEPFQEVYKEYVFIFLDRWFQHWAGYQETQSGVLQRIANENEGKVAVIVGDGVAYEVAEQVALKVKPTFNLKKDVIIADVPSETENNMSRIYMDNGCIESIHRNREQYFADQNEQMEIDFIRLDEVSEEPLPGSLLVCTYKDIDDMGEKLQQKALKYFPETVDFFADKISLLLSSGYTKVYLITDHGFVLTGILDEADKISVTPDGEFKKAERYIRTELQQPSLNTSMIEVERHYDQFEYLYFSKSMNPFKTPGVYGFSHGGVSPQEIVTPYFCWERSGCSSALLSVSIKNKTDLKDITGELFPVTIQAAEGAGDLLTVGRKIFLVFFAGKKQVNKSDVITINSKEAVSKEYAFDGHTEMEVHILDATTKEQLDRATIRQNTSRDLGGLL